MWGEKRFGFGERPVGRQKGRVVVKEGRKESGLQSRRTVVCRSLSPVACRPPSVGWLSIPRFLRHEEPRITQNPEFTPNFQLDEHLNT